MATKNTLLQTSSSSSSGRTLTGSTTIPAKAKIISVMAAGVDSSKISHTYDETNGTVGITLASVPYTRRSTHSYSYPFAGKGGGDGGYDWKCYYSGTSQTVGVNGGESCPANLTSYSTTYYFEYDVIVTYETNNIPTITLSTMDNRILYENDTFNLTGSCNDKDIGNVVTVKYSIDNGTPENLRTFVSDGSVSPFNKPLIFKRDKLYDGSASVTGDLQEGIAHTLSVWAEDDQGGKSTVHSRTFNVIPNRPGVKVDGQLRVVETISCKVDGQTKEVVKMWTKVNGVLREI